MSVKPIFPALEMSFGPHMTQHWLLPIPTVSVKPIFPALEMSFGPHMTQHWLLPIPCPWDVVWATHDTTLVITHSLPFWHHIEVPTASVNLFSAHVMPYGPCTSVCFKTHSWLFGHHKGCPKLTSVNRFPALEMWYGPYTISVNPFPAFGRS